MAGITNNGSPRLGDRWRIAIWGTAAFLLLLPLVAMQFTDEVDWDETDFIVIGAMLFAACGTVEMAARLSRNTAYRAAVGVAVVAAFLLIWINLAVGIIGNENNPANLMFGGVLVVGVIGAYIARFQPYGMARALVATAIAQASIGVIALIASWRLEAVLLPGCFAILWLVSAGLFWKAAREQVPGRSGAG